jgi:rhamnosyltransferase
MREDFFIDHVDIEWSHRARAAGFSLFGVGAAVMFHSMGEHALRVWYFGWRQESAYSPVRVYYRIRNFVALCRLPSIRWRWKLRNGWYIVGVVYTQTVFGQQRLAALRMAARGLWDGLRGRMGPWRG